MCQTGDQSDLDDWARHVLFNVMLIGPGTLSGHAAGAARRFSKYRLRVLVRYMQTDVPVITLVTSTDQAFLTKKSSCTCIMKSSSLLYYETGAWVLFFSSFSSFAHLLAPASGPYRTTHLKRSAEARLTSLLSARLRIRVVGNPWV